MNVEGVLVRCGGRGGAGSGMRHGEELGAEGVQTQRRPVKVLGRRCSEWLVSRPEIEIAGVV